MSISAFEHPYLSGLVGDEETGAMFSASADIGAMLAFERALALAEGEAGVIPSAAAGLIADLCGVFEPDVVALRAGVARDGVVVPQLIKQLKAAAGSDAAQFVHLGATSQDVIDTSLMLRLKGVLTIFSIRLERLSEQFAQLEKNFGARPMMAHTRMQAALPISVANRLRSWSAPLERHRTRLRHQISALPIQFGGAAGNLDQLGPRASEVRRRLADHLGLADQVQWQSQRDGVVDVADTLSLISGSLGKFGQDIALLAQMGEEIRLAGGGGSSAMAHKQNPVAAEALVTLARHNAVLVSGMHQSIVHEQERSGAAWTLEWLLLPQMAIATGASLRLASELVVKIQSLGRTDG
ncbi:3-carboxy-cis,cis-muconate cycloisomerase [Rhizobium sp. SAFR-030]|uniref:3-carboxy-cis,cis-muconate cycloisomerase n=1 Tax=Rhizobium sp. SAFR-030 TaxID=3387277 RepID=UPI003F820EEA